MNFNEALFFLAAAYLCRCTSIGRALGSRLGNWAFRAVSGTRGVKDATTSFRVYSPEVLRFLLATDSRRFSGYSFFSTTIALAPESLSWCSNSRSV